MTALLVYPLVAASAIGLVVLSWRAAARVRPLPCPSWLGWTLDNSYTRAVAGAAAVLDRLALAPGMRVLDAGCGPGRLTIPAAERVGPTGEVVALDAQDAMLARVRAVAAARGLTNVRTLRSEITVVGPGALATGYFDRAFLVAVLGEVPDRAAAMRALYETLCPGGMLAVTEVLPDPHYQSRRTVRRLGEGSGLRLEQTAGTPFGFTMVFRKPSGDTTNDA